MPSPVSLRAASARAFVFVCVGALASSCAGRYGGPRSLAGGGVALMAGGSTAWVVGEHEDRGALTSAGFAAVAAGIASLVVAGGWMASIASCTTDADCQDSETCREVPAPPGGFPYSQCVPR